MPLLTPRAKPIIGWLLATLGALMATLFCACRALWHLVGFFLSAGYSPPDGVGRWMAATLLCGLVCFGCALRFVDSGKQT
jgi:hypothetical protein